MTDRKPALNVKLTKSVEALLREVSAAAPGEQIVYGSTDTGLRRELRELAWDIYEAGTVLLVQKRNASNGFDYVMIRTAKPMAPYLSATIAKIACA